MNQPNWSLDLLSKWFAVIGRHQSTITFSLPGTRLFSNLTHPDVTV